MRRHGASAAVATMMRQAAKPSNATLPKLASNQLRNPQAALACFSWSGGGVPTRRETRLFTPGAVLAASARHDARSVAMRRVRADEGAGYRDFCVLNS